MFNKIKNLFKKPEPEKVDPPVVAKPRKPRKKKEAPTAAPIPQLTAKELATQRGEPWVEVTHFEIDSQDIQTGNFTIDFNDKFVINLIKAGYKYKEGDSDHDIVDRWFTQICRSIVLEQHEQMMADPENRSDMRVVRTRNLGDGRTEVS
jgi:hypothetical protein